MEPRLYRYELWAPWRSPKAQVYRYTVASRQKDVLDLAEREWHELADEECPLSRRCRFRFRRYLFAERVHRFTPQATDALKEKHGYEGDLKGLAQFLTMKEIGPEVDWDVE